MLWFWLATLTPIPILLTAGFVGGVWSLLALFYMTIFTYFFDSIIKGAAVRCGSDGEFPSGHALSITLGLLHFALLAVAVFAISGGSRLAVFDRFVCFLAFGQFFGQVSNANAHELIHRSGRWPRRLGAMVYISLLFGHHVSAHRLVHHVWVATPQDPNSPKPGESFFRFWPRAWIGSFQEGLKAETALRRRATSTQPIWSHPYVSYVLGALAILAFTAVIFGGVGVAALIAICGYAQMQLLLSDYVQHYGLRRTLDANGKPEPVSNAHSWNSPQPFSSALMLNAPRHSDHHLNPTRSYPSLRLNASMPTLPRSLPAMATLALWPRMWRRVMDPRVKEITASQD